MSETLPPNVMLPQFPDSPPGSPTLVELSSPSSSVKPLVDDNASNSSGWSPVAASEFGFASPFRDDGFSPFPEPCTHSGDEIDDDDNHKKETIVSPEVEHTTPVGKFSALSFNYYFAPDNTIFSFYRSQAHCFSFRDQ